ncbi:MAG: HU family DNA-binding protein [Pseudomonadales bacterium]|nr:HU family DNA-binding protein [Pseudomonadales bacterium]
MNKSQLVRMVADHTEMSNAMASRAVDATFDAIMDALATHEDVVVPGFGKFSVTVRGAREVRNLHTGETMMSSAKHAPRFKPGKTMKDRVELIPVE